MLHEHIDDAIAERAHFIRGKLDAGIDHLERASFKASSSCSFVNAVLMNSSWRAPALSAIAFQPLVVGTVTRTLTSPRASRTGRMTPGITERIDELFASSRSSIPRTPSMMLCSTLRRSLCWRSLMTGCFHLNVLRY